jgi:hypothetical protein
MVWLRLERKMSLPKLEKALKQLGKQLPLLKLKPQKALK